MATSANFALLGLLFVSVWCFSSANFVFDFKLSSVSTHVTCEFEGDCDTFVTFCLRERSSSESTNTNNCPLGSSGRINAYPLPGTQQRSITSERRWPGGFQMYVRALDDDAGVTSDDFLDDIFITRTLQVSNVFTDVMEYTGNNNRVTVGMSFRVRCQNNYYGADCDTFCVAQDDDKNGHYTCNSDGSIQCREGFEDASNECRDHVTNPCDSSPCGNNGECSRVGKSNYTCECNNGYSGPDCSKCQLGFEKEGDECIQIILQPTLNTDNPTISSATVNQTVSNEESKPTTVTDSQVAAAVIIGSAAGGAVVLILVFLTLVILIIAISIANRRRSRIDENHTPDEAIETEVNIVYGVMASDDSKTIETQVNMVYGILAPGESHRHHDVGLYGTGPESEEHFQNNEYDYVACN